MRGGFRSVAAFLIPAALTYWKFPNGPIKASGALAGFTVNVTGAFAAYVIVFLLTGPIVSRMEDALSASLIPMWNINARVNVVDENGKPANPRLLDSLAIVAAGKEIAQS